MHLISLLQPNIFSIGYILRERIKRSENRNEINQYFFRFVRTLLMDLNISKLKIRAINLCQTHLTLEGIGLKGIFLKAISQKVIFQKAI